jgi:hypothetical protein
MRGKYADSHEDACSYRTRTISKVGGKLRLISSPVIHFSSVLVCFLVQNGSGAHPVSYPMGTRSSFLGVKGPGREADHSPPSSAEVKNAWSYTSTRPIRLHGVVLS